MEPNNCCINNQMFYFNWMIISKIFRAQEGGCRSQNDSLTTKQPEMFKIRPKYSWIGRLVRTHTKLICRETKRATTDLNICRWKALDEAHPMVRCKFLYLLLGELFLKNRWKNNQHFSPHSWMRLVESSNTEFSGASEVPQSRGKLISQEVQLLCFCSKIDLAHQNLFRSRSIETLHKIQVITSTIDQFVTKFFKLVVTNKLYARMLLNRLHIAIIGERSNFC